MSCLVSYYFQGILAMIAPFLWLYYWTQIRKIDLERDDLIKIDMERHGNVIVSELLVIHDIRKYYTVLCNNCIHNYNIYVILLFKGRLPIRIF